MCDLQQLLDELKGMSFFDPGEMCIIDYSASKAIDKRIGSVGSMGVVKEVYKNLEQLEADTGVASAFQGCEYINRTVTIKRANFNPLTMEEATVVPGVHTGGSLSTYAYQQMEDPIVVEHITVPKGIDMGQTLTGMHIKHVCVPVRTNIKQIGEAIVTIAASRPKKIGDERAKYQ